MSIARLLAVVLMSLGATLARAESLVLLTENLAPFNMSSNGSNFAKDDAVKGISADTLRLVCERAGVECQMILRFPWDRVYQQALKDTGYGLFSAARTPEREALFKWVGPIASNDWVLLGRADTPISVNSLQDAAKYRIGGYKGDAISQHLIDRGLAVETSLRDNENVKKLEKGQIDLWVTADPSGSYMARQEGLSDIKVVHRFHTADLFLALNKDTPDDLVRKLQTALDALRAEGALEKVRASY
ncbi:substrate-binding periplasmic protein [Pseudomonas mangiferae]|uniref:Transporter substrate-binding domain-containing protein n=1 Tax=Pseudomonas mangiferae TaxID=2593654 RepID=A0A553GYQ4_9PSED|nr:transporter substrate-binding domain-containing protein [Pseudomonas mangiferae]TRX74638.1 transporter substrate-binding domain-containing protein [Pseudomonas mangiferae]